MTSIEIREATIDDLPTLKEFEQGIVTAERPFDETLRPDPISYYDLGQLVVADDSVVVVATDSGKIIASAYIQFRKAKPYLRHSVYGYLGFMFVVTDQRGKGVNARIVEALKDIARANNVKELRLDVYDGNDSALRAYEKVGFERHMIEMRLGI